MQAARELHSRYQISMEDSLDPGWITFTEIGVARLYVAHNALGKIVITLEHITNRKHEVKRPVSWVRRCWSTVFLLRLEEIDNIIFTGWSTQRSIIMGSSKQ